MANGASSGFFLVEVEGVTAFEAVEADTPGKEQEEVEIHVGNKELPYLVRGKSKIDVVTLKGAFSNSSAGRDFHKLMQDHSRGINVDKITCRVIQLDENGRDVLAINEYIECIPKAFKPLGNKGDAKEAAMFEIKLRPSDYECIF